MNIDFNIDLETNDILFNSDGVETFEKKADGIVHVLVNSLFIYGRENGKYGYFENENIYFSNLWSVAPRNDENFVKHIEMELNRLKNELSENFERLDLRVSNSFDKVFIFISLKLKNGTRTEKEIYL